MTALDIGAVVAALDPEGKGGRRHADEVAAAVRDLAPHIEAAAVPELVRDTILRGDQLGAWSAARTTTIRRGRVTVPKSVVLRSPSLPADRFRPVDVPLRDELAPWATGLPLAAAQRDLLIAVNDWLRRTNGGKAPVVAAALADLLGQRVDPHKRVRPGVQLAAAEAGHHLVQFSGHEADLRLRQRRDTQRGGQLLHPPSRDPQQVAGGHHRGQRPFRPPPVLQEPRVVRALAQLRDRQLDGPGPGIPLPQPVTVAAVHTLGGDLPVAGVAADFDIGVHHPLREPLDHLSEHIRARRLQRLLEPAAGNRHNVTDGHFVLLRLAVITSKDHEVAVSGHADTPDNKRKSHSGISYPIHHSRGRELDLGTESIASLN